LERFDFDYIFKCDDDTYLHAERLCGLPKEGAAPSTKPPDCVATRPSS
jgi:hypothetical protein